MQKAVTFLGHYVSVARGGNDDQKTAAVREWPATLVWVQFSPRRGKRERGSLPNTFEPSTGQNVITV